VNLVTFYSDSFTSKQKIRILVFSLGFSDLEIEEAETKAREWEKKVRDNDYQ
jgi:hypothetical protein